MDEVIRMKTGKLRRCFEMRKLVVGILVVVFSLGLTTGAFAQWEGLKLIKKHPDFVVVFASLPLKERHELIKLRETNPKEFKKAVGQRIRERIGELQEIEQANPQEFKQIKQKAVREVKTYAKQLQEDIKLAARFKKAAARAMGKQNLRNQLVFESLPVKKKEKIVALRERYQQALETVLKERTEELQAIKEEDPKKYEQILQGAAKSAKERMAKGRRRKPGVFERFGKMKPEYLKEKLEWLKSEDPELYRYLIKKANAEHRS